MPGRTVSGVGSGWLCAVCEDETLATEPEVEVYEAQRPSEPYVFHRRCYVLWFAESFRARR